MSGTVCMCLWSNKKGLTKEMSKIAVLIPCYNESKTVQKVVSDWKKELPEAEIYVYDNNSTDGTDELAKEAGAIVRYEYQQGKGNVIRRMFREIDAECYIMVDGDGEVILLTVDGIETLIYNIVFPKKKMSDIFFFY